VNDVDQLYTERNSCGIARFPSNSTAFLYGYGTHVFPKTIQGFITTYETSKCPILHYMFTREWRDVTREEKVRYRDTCSAGCQVILTKNAKRNVFYCQMNPKMPNVKRRPSHCLSFDDSFLENPREYPRKSYILPETRIPADDFRRWQYVSIFISFHAIIFESRAVKSRRWIAYGIGILASTPKLPKE